MNHFNRIMGALLLNALGALLFSQTLGLSFFVCYSCFLLLAMLVGAVGSLTQQAPSQPSGLMLAGVFKELWLGDLLGRFWDDNDFLADGKDWTPFVDNDKLHISEIGAEPTVVKNRAAYPVPIAERPDADNEVILDEYSTDNTVHRKLQSVELAYDKRMSIINDHKAALNQKIADDGLYNIAATGNAATTPIIKTTGAVDAISGYKALTKADIALLAAMCDTAKFPKIGRKLILPPNMFWGFVATDTLLQNQAAYNGGTGGQGSGAWVEYYGFIIASRNGCPVYDTTTLAKKPAGTLPGAGINPGGVLYVKGQTFGKGLGSASMFASLDDAREHGDVISFGLRAIVAAQRNKLRGAIVFG